MHTKLIITGTIVLSALLYSFRSKDKEIILSPLQDYGKEVFIREKCSNCHSFDFKDSTLISLDGIGGRYPDSWHYNHFLDPSTVVIESPMPPYSKLEKAQINIKDLVTAYVSKVGSGRTNEKEVYLNLEDEIRTIAIRLEKDKINNYYNGYTEMVALIAYLQSIKPSEGLKQLDAKLAEEFRAKEEQQNVLWKAWDNLLKKEKVMAIKNIDSNIGKEIFSLNCTPCHGPEGCGGIGPNLTDEYWLHGNTVKDICKTIREGIPKKGMLAWKTNLSKDDIVALTAYIVSIKGNKSEFQKEPQGKKY